MNEECCNHNCNQGRDCPLRKNKQNSSPPHIVDSGASVMVKELTDEEIAEVFFGLEVGHSATEFARAILRKAQEK
jgi:hypothetical protein